MKTLEELEQLEQSRFGRPEPRHGLKLLYWFVNDCLYLNQNSVLKFHCSPANGDFGFHIFENRYEKYSGKLLPVVHFPYYCGGNLGKLKAYDLPRYVREHYTGSRDDSNMDRIIVSINNKSFEKVYVTEHSDRSNFNKHATFCISKHLIMTIRDLTLEDFLLKTGYLRLQGNLFSAVPSQDPRYLRNSQASGSAPSTTSSNIPAITSVRSQDIFIDIESPPVMLDNNTPTAKHQLNNSVQDNINIYNFQDRPRDNRTTSTCTPTVKSSRNQDTDIESHPVSQIITDDTQTYLTSRFRAARCCYCTIL